MYLKLYFNIQYSLLRTSGAAGRDLQTTAMLSLSQPVSSAGKQEGTLVSECLFFALLVIRQGFSQVNLRHRKNIIPLPVW